jgi:hypothetical protein
LDPFQDCKRLELKEAIFSPEMIWEAVPQCRCSKSERVFTVPCILHIDAGLFKCKKNGRNEYGISK